MTARHKYWFWHPKPFKKSGVVDSELGLRVFKMSREDALRVVYQYILELVGEVKSGKRNSPLVSVEEVARVVRVKSSKVDWAMGRLLQKDKLIRRRVEDGYELAARYEPSMLMTIDRSQLQVSEFRTDGTLVVWDEIVPPKKPRYSKRLQRRIW